MLQWLALDRVSRGPYYAGAVATALVLLACGVRVEPLAPEALPAMSREQAAQWAEPFQPVGARLYDLRWTYQTQQGTTRGRAALRFVPPDSVRFDYRAPFGRSGAAVIVGDEILWSRPEEAVDRLIQIAPLFWAAMGIPLDPPAEASVLGAQVADVRTWQYAIRGDTLTYQASTTLPGASLRAEMRTGRDVLGTADVVFADSVLTPVSATMLFPSSASAVFFTVNGIETLDETDPDIWNEP